MSNNKELVYLNSESDDSDYLVVSDVTSREPTIITEDYEGDNSDKEGSPANDKNFHKLLDSNVFRLKDVGTNSTVIGLTEKQDIYISGVFNIQIMKGGIIYNDVHYNSSKESITFWHPLTDAIPEIKASYYAGWNEPLYLHAKCKKLIDPKVLEDFVCVLRIYNGPINGLMDIHNLYPDVNHLWQPKNDLLVYSQDINTDGKNVDTFTILDKDQGQFTPQTIPASWLSTIENLFVTFKNASYDTRIIILGGKNTGKSTFLRLLCETFMNKTNINEDGSTTTCQDDIWYLDLDPGQPEYSEPECISLTEIRPNHNPVSLGQHLGQHNFKFLKQLYYGATSPQENPSLYLNQIDDLIEFFENKRFVGTSLLNLPGWIKGFGMNIVNHVIRQYKPTHIILIDSTRLEDELLIPQSFSNSLQDSYKPNVFNVSSISSNSTISNSFTNKIVPAKFHAAQIRTLKMLLTFHRTISSNSLYLNYKFAPLLESLPIQVSIGVDYGIQGIQFCDEFHHLHEDDIKGALEGTIVAISLWRRKRNSNNNLVQSVGLYPIIEQSTPIKELSYYSLALIHSIDEEKKLINLFIPQLHVRQIREKTKEIEQLNKDEDEPYIYSWIINRSKTETPFCELYPKNIDSIKGKYDSIPYISTEKRKKHEHVWKVRKNVMRRGHSMK